MLYSRYSCIFIGLYIHQDAISKANLNFVHIRTRTLHFDTLNRSVKVSDDGATPGPSLGRTGRPGPPSSTL
jgi:hypothetical protein